MEHSRARQGPARAIGLNWATVKVKAAGRPPKSAVWSARGVGSGRAAAAIVRTGVAPLRTVSDIGFRRVARAARRLVFQLSVSARLHRTQPKRHVAARRVADGREMDRRQRQIRARRSMPR